MNYKDSLVMTCIVYKNVSSEKDSFEGLWREKNAEAPLYIEFTEDKNLRVYRKEPGIEVLYGCGAA